MAAGASGIISGVLILAFLLSWFHGTAGSPGVDDLVPPVLAICFAFSLFVQGHRIGRRQLARHHDDPAALSTRDVVRPGGIATHDVLTGLVSPPAFDARLRQALAGRRHGDPVVAVHYVNIRAFSAINRSHGHAAGDVLLRHVAARLLASLREGDAATRLWGDHFAVLQVDVLGPAAAIRLSDRLLDALAGPFDLFGRAVRIEARIGIALHPADAAEPEHLLEYAKRAMEGLGRDGPGCAFFERSSDEEARLDQQLRRDLRVAADRDELELHFQPQVDLHSRLIVGLEALARWNHPGHGPVPPETFIPMAEDDGSIIGIGDWILRSACRQLRCWQDAGLSPVQIAVNISPVQIDRGDLAERVRNIVEETGVSPDLLELEITERVMMRRTTAVARTLDELRSLGIRLSIDDFGAGHASLSYLNSFTFDEIKVDRSLVATMLQEPGSAAVLRAALTLGQSLRINVVAEGVETEEQLQTLVAENCPVAQGFYFSEPRAAPEIEMMLRASGENVHLEKSSDLQ